MRVLKRGMKGRALVQFDWVPSLKAGVTLKLKLKDENPLSDTDTDEFYVLVIQQKEAQAIIAFPSDFTFEAGDVFLAFPRRKDDIYPLSATGPRLVPGTESFKNYVTKEGFNERRNFYLLAGLGLAQLNAENESSSNFIAKLGLGYSWNHLESNFSYRRSVYNFNNNDSLRQWYQLNLGYGWTLPTVANAVPVFAFLAGLAYYTNKIASTDDFRYLSSIISYDFGFRTRFTYNTKLDLGLAALGSFGISDTRHLYLQSDLGYWFSPFFCGGLGLWFDSYVKDSPGTKITERSQAAEILAKYYF